jgi:NAD(P)-dependent dehydrogenase (short-subunit alcohol dehydrogenase family)
MIFLLFLYLTALPLILCKRAPREEPPLVVLITGCSTGIGKSIALEFANQPQKYKVWATMRSTAAWDLPERPNFNILAMDVTSDESVTTAVDRIISEEGRIDVLINNAGYGLVGTVESVDISDGKVRLS